MIRRDCPKKKEKDAATAAAGGGNPSANAAKASNPTSEESITFDDDVFFEFGLFSFVENDALSDSVANSSNSECDEIQATEDLTDDGTADSSIICEGHDSQDLAGISTPTSTPTFSPEFALKVGNSTGEEWWIDSGATQHMSPNEKDFEHYIPFDDPVKVNLADKSFLLAHGSGTIKMRLFDVNQSVNVLLNNALFIPKIQNKLFSVSSAVDDGGSLVFDKEGVTLNKDGKSKKIGHKNGKLYQLNCEPDDVKESCYLAKQATISLWHERFGHLNSGDLKLLHENDMVKGMNISGIGDSGSGGGEVCHGCALGKSKRLPFPKKSEHKTTKPL